MGGVVPFAPVDGTWGGGGWGRDRGVGAGVVHVLDSVEDGETKDGRRDGVVDRPDDGGVSVGGRRTRGGALGSGAHETQTESDWTPRLSRLPPRYGSTTLRRVVDGMTPKLYEEVVSLPSPGPFQ